METFLSWLPGSSQELNVWTVASAVGMCVVASLGAWLRGKKIDVGFLLKSLLAGAALPTLLMLATVVFNQDNLALVSNLDVYISLAGVGGIIVIIVSIFS